MGRATFSRKGHWGISVKKMSRDQWEAFVRMLPAPGLHREYFAEGELVPGGPYQHKEAARTAGEAYVTLKNRQEVKTPAVVATDRRSG